MLRPLVVALLVGLAIPGTSGAQEGEGYDDVIQEARDALLLLSEGCDYAEYLSMATRLGDAWDMISSLGEWVPGEWRSRGIPVWDITSTIVEGLNTRYSERAAVEMGRSVILQVESTCQHAIQADETNRIYQLARAANRNIGADLDFLLEMLFPEDREPFEIPGLGEEWLGGDFANEFTREAPIVQTPHDSRLNLVHTTATNTLASTEDMLAALEDYQDQVEILMDGMRLRAEEETYEDEGEVVTRWICPEGYPDPQEDGIEEVDENGVPICGTVGPERAQVISSQATVLMGQIEAIRLGAEAHEAQIAATKLLVDLDEWKAKEQLRRTPVVF